MEDLEQTIDQMFNGHAEDLIFVVDHTYSMKSQHDRLPKLLQSYVIKCISERAELKSVGLVVYDDHYGPNPQVDQIPTFFQPNGFVNYGLTDNLEEFVSWVRNTPIGDGGDIGECFLCGLKAAKMLSNNSRIWIITDAPLAKHYGQPYCMDFPEDLGSNVSVILTREYSSDVFYIDEWRVKYPGLSIILTEIDFSPLK